jgi:LytS/YehU family sensor histidine kinase
MIVCSLLAAVIGPIIEISFGPLPTWRETVISYVGGIFYSLAIGGILGPLAPSARERTAGMRVIPRWLIRAVLIAAGTAAGCLLAGFPMRMIIGPDYQYWVSFRGSYGIAVVLAALITAFFSTYERFRAKLQTSELQLKEKEVEREKALKLATEATLSSLESRLHPHFLFNTINSISSLIQEDPVRAEKMLSQMADLLRFSLDSARAGLVPLARELKIVHDYLEIEKARFEDRLRYRIQVSSEFDDLPFPPLSLQTLVENSVKYAVSVTRSGADVLVRAFRDGSYVVLTAEDNGPGFDATDLPPGHGLSSLTERLQSLYAGAAHLGISSRPGHTVITLQVPLTASNQTLEKPALIASRL